jgi:penicillin-insensitive murein endopeptidase
MTLSTHYRTDKGRACVVCMVLASLLCMVSLPFAGRGYAQPVIDAPTLVYAVDVLRLTPAPARIRPVKAERAEEFPRLPDEPAERSVSVGTVTEGRVVSAARLPLPGQSYGVLPRQNTRHLIWATDGLIEAIVDAANEVAAEYPGSILWLGNIGARHGGDILWSVSHNAGRDADLAFYTTDPTGNPVAPPDLLHYDRRGRSVEYGGYYRFDVARNWALVRSLVHSPHVRLQYLFISDGLRSLLLEWARTHGTSEDTLARASALLNQPGGALPHDDHLHLRTYCGRFDLGGGCEDMGIVHSWIDDLGAVREARIRQAVSLLRAQDAETRIRAVRRLEFVDADTEVASLRPLLEDSVPRVRREAAEVIAALGSPAQTSWLVQRWEDETEPEVQLALLRAIGQLGGATGVSFLVSILGSPSHVVVRQKPVDLRVVAIDALARSLSPAAAGRLALVLVDEDVEVRFRALQALRLITNRAGVDVCPRSAAAPGLPALQADWSNWIEATPCDSRREWVDAGFARAGYDTSGSGVSRARTLAEAAGDERWWVRVNAQKELMRLSSHEPRSLFWTAADARAYWQRWVRRNGSRIRN